MNFVTKLPENDTSVSKHVGGRLVPTYCVERLLFTSGGCRSKHLIYCVFVMCLIVSTSLANILNEYRNALYYREWILQPLHSCGYPQRSALQMILQTFAKQCIGSQFLTFRRRNFLLNFSTPCIYNVNTGTKKCSIMK